MDDQKRNKAFSDDDFEDIFSSSGKDDFKDIFSDSGEDAGNTPDTYEDISSGRDEEPIANTDDPYAGFFDTPPVADDSPADTRYRTAVNTTPEKMPYRYNENAPVRTRARNGDEIYSGAEKAERPRKKKTHLGRKIFCVILVLVLLFVGGAGAYGYLRVQKILAAVDYQPLSQNQYIANSELASADYVKNILLIGVDAREGEEAEKTRSDTMMLVTIDTRNKQIKLTSFLRDMYLEIPGYREDKLNAAQSHGGTQLLVDTLEYNFKVDIDNYMLVSFDMFTAIVDELGGVNVEITDKEAKYINSKDHMSRDDGFAFPEELSGGMQHFTGAQALWYSRIRYLDSDFMRTQRQRKVITAIVKEAVGQSPFALLDMVEKVMPMVKTDLTEDEMMDLGLHALTYLKYDIVQMQVPLSDAYKSATRRGQSVLLPDMDKNRTAFKQFVFEKADVPADDTEA
ncbi:MAG: LCP family protein [Ruminococcus sp.]|nr:LCP family protein [Ruminococcus sp.]